MLQCHKDAPFRRRIAGYPTSRENIVKSQRFALMRHFCLRSPGNKLACSVSFQPIVRRLDVRFASPVKQICMLACCVWRGCWRCGAVPGSANMSKAPHPRLRRTAHHGSSAGTGNGQSAGGDDAVGLQPRAGSIANCQALCMTARSRPAEIAVHAGGNGGQHHVVKLCRGQIKRQAMPLHVHAGLAKAQHDERCVPRAIG